MRVLLPRTCGIYEILCVISGKSYVGSSRHIENRWRDHQRELRKGIHRSPRLQLAWAKHGEWNFVFSILEECSIEDLFKREQFHIDAKKRDYNSMPKVRVITPEMRRKMLAKMRAFKAAITHCPRGHEYSPENTAISVRGARLCRSCNRERVKGVYAAETPEQYAARKAKNRAYYIANKAQRAAAMRAWALKNRERLREYQRNYRPIKNAARRAKAQNQ